MKALSSLLRSFSFAFVGLFSLVSLAMAVIILASGPQTVNFSLVPVEGRPQAYWLIGLGLVGLLVLLAAVRGGAQKVYLAWTALVVVLVVRYFYASYSYVPDSGDYKLALYSIFAAFLAAIGAGMRPAERS